MEKCFDNWFKRMQKCLDLNGEYFEKNFIFVLLSRNIKGNPAPLIGSFVYDFIFFQNRFIYCVDNQIVSQVTIVNRWISVRIYQRFVDGDKVYHINSLKEVP